MLILGMTEQEIRVLQEFRRLMTTELGVGAITAIRHPAGGGEAPAWSLVEKGMLEANAERTTFTLTEPAREFLAVDAKPLFEGSAADTDSENE